MKRRGRFIRVSPNELYALLRRTFEAHFSHDRDFEDAAQLVLWLETRGVDGVRMLTQALANDTLPMPLLSSEAPHRCVVDAGGGSLLSAASSATDLAIAQAGATGHCHLTIEHCSHRIAILACLARCGRLGFAAAAWWQTGQDAQTHRAVIEAGAAEPGYAAHTRTAMNAASSTAVHLVCATNVAMLDETRAEAAWQGDFEIAPPEFRRRFDACVQDGLVIADDHYRALSAVADRVLVPATEASRRGAGE